MGLNDYEYGIILQKLGREPNLVELGMISVMWSEHCGYKHSRPVLARFKKYKESLEGGGHENAGVVALGDGIAVTMKIESHNHPSAVEPYQGAATGVGGIVRDILAMGARPVALLNSLRFGPIEGAGADVARNRYLFEHVVEGIAGYGNCVGIPTVGGEVFFHPSFTKNPLVNAMCVGVLRVDQITTAGASGIGNPVLYLGSATGRDGIHGATFASEALGADSEASRPNVQIGDPFAEKLLIEATLEALETGAVVAIQDMGAAGLTCSTVEMSAKGGVGMRVNLDLVPVRESDMSAYEMMLSETQERMFVVAEMGREGEIIEIFHRWGLHAVEVGSVIEGDRVIIEKAGEVVADLPAKLLADECPTYKIQPEPSASAVAAAELDLSQIPDEKDPKKALLQLLASPNVTSREWIYRQFDFQVQTQTLLGPGNGDGAVIHLRGTPYSIALAVDAHSRATSLDPYAGGLLSVYESCRNVACMGAKPLALTDGLNFGNPEIPQSFWFFERCVQGIADASEALEAPVISGNVSFYNESEGTAILPTAMIGAVGTLPVGMKPLGLREAEHGDLVVLISPEEAEGAPSSLGSSEYLAVRHKLEAGLPRRPLVNHEVALINLLHKCCAEGIRMGAHDVSFGGALVALAKICAITGLGVEVSLPKQSRLDESLFGEIPGTVFCTVSPQELEKFEQLCGMPKLTFAVVGHLNATSGALQVDCGESRVSATLEEIKGSFGAGLGSKTALPV
ncbi:MAG: phosphoribosylformylglycinamidine synthase subunit PurL [Fimbriimonadaceae bacterium]